MEKLLIFDCGWEEEEDEGDEEETIVVTGDGELL